MEIQHTETYGIWVCVFLFPIYFVESVQMKRRVSSTDLGVRHPPVCILTPLIISCVTMGKLLNLSET